MQIKFYTVTQVADEIWGVNNRTVYRRIQTGELAAVRISAKCYRISAEALEEYASTHRVETKKPDPTTVRPRKLAGREIDEIVRRVREEVKVP